MRKIIKEHKNASVIPIALARKKECKMELGVDEAKQCIYLRMSGTDPCVGMTADRAEELAVSIQDFVYELRNGGKLQ